MLELVLAGELTHKRANIWDNMLITEWEEAGIYITTPIELLLYSNKQVKNILSLCV